MERVWLALGSNLSEPLQQAGAALDALAKLLHTQLVACSSYYRSRPLGPQDQPDFLNAVVALDTALTPEELLDHIQSIESLQGRTRKTHRWGPRVLDLDILLFGNRTVTTSQLVVPHYDMYNREFMLYPLAELDPNLHFPDGNSLTDRLQQISRNGLSYWDDVHRCSTP
ncbi:MAG: 2-amino-4-hydroxy-6- hydroxymethyldihydropteridine diphosphokinase [Sodalis sp. Psp]|nr:2-amino-4-hydroxy-6- hydroxymethyldihydropteridine diphosphokinase [Sodalis sp. Psp]MCR3757206.1 2-amino-4-hydroxy-6- hydroxymethyldihydropteridine diphosphokinase [Sodalis sp. Ppy]